MRFTVIDNWISARGLQELSGRQAAVYRATEDKVLPQNGDKAPRSHGTICAAILAEALPSTAELTAVSAEGEAGAVMLENLCTALAWCIETHPDYLCMSLGTSKWLETRQLGRLTKQLAETGTHIFAACANNGHVAFPAAYPWVMGVRYKAGVAGLYREKGSPVGCGVIVGDFTSPVLEKIEKENPAFANRFNSMAAPYASGKMVSEGSSLSGLPLWRDSETVNEVDALPMPVVGLTGSVEGIKELLALLQKENYQAALLTDRMETNWEDMLLHVTAERFPEWVAPLAESGILLVDVEESLSPIKHFCDCTIHVSREGDEAAYEKILDFFGVEEQNGSV